MRSRAAHPHLARYVLAGLCAWLSALQATHAVVPATFVVTNAGDDVDNNLGDGERTSAMVGR
jgi:hypothetical protein